MRLVWSWGITLEDFYAALLDSVKKSKDPGGGAPGENEGG